MPILCNYWMKSPLFGVKTGQMFIAITRIRTKLDLHFYYEKSILASADFLFSCFPTTFRCFAWILRLTSPSSISTPAARLRSTIAFCFFAWSKFFSTWAVTLKELKCQSLWINYYRLACATSALIFCFLVCSSYTNCSVRWYHRVLCWVPFFGIFQLKTNQIFYIP